MQSWNLTKELSLTSLERKNLIHIVNISETFVDIQSGKNVNEVME